MNARICALFFAVTILSSSMPMAGSQPHVQNAKSGGTESVPTCFGLGDLPHIGRFFRALAGAFSRLPVVGRFFRAEKGYDLLIKGGTIIDGSGNRAYTADIAIDSGKIARIDEEINTRAERVIDANGMMIAPGFIDIHTHCDGINIEGLNQNQNYLMQGVTTVVCGNCGDSPWPINDWFEECERIGIGTNALMLVGHGTIREQVMGFEDREATPEEMGEMETLLEQALEEGAIGMSTGLEYAPGCYSDTEELVELAEVLQKRNAIFTSHMRGEQANVINSIEEIIEIAEDSKVSVEVSHLKVNGRASWGLSEGAIKEIDEARSSGLNISADQYPYTASSTGFEILIPDWAEAGGEEELIANLESAEMRERIEEEIAYNMIQRVGEDLERIQIASYPACPEYNGKTMKEICEINGLEPTIENCTKMIVEMRIKGRADVIYHAMHEDDIRNFIAQPWVAIGSDGSSIAFGEGNPHPRNYGTFPRVIARYVREERILTPEDAIRKMSYLPAQKIGLKNRGLIREGFWADITIFDLNEIEDRATYTQPHQYPEGIEYVIVNGQIAVDHGELTGALSGKALKRDI